MEIFNPPGERRYPSWGFNYRGYYDQEKLQIFSVSKFSRMTEKVMKIHCFPGFISKISFAKPQKGPKSIQKVRNCVFSKEIAVFDRFTSRKRCCNFVHIMFYRGSRVQSWSGITENT